MNLPDPLAAMYAAVEQIRSGEIAEVVLDYTDSRPDGSEERLEITIRREVRKIVIHGEIGDVEPEPEA